MRAAYAAHGRSVGVDSAKMGIVHGKSLYVRFHDGNETFLIGSCNWTCSSTCNIEFGIQLHNPARSLPGIGGRNGTAGGTRPSLCKRPRLRGSGTVVSRVRAQVEAEVVKEARRLNSELGGPWVPSRATANACDRDALFCCFCML